MIYKINLDSKIYREIIDPNGSSGINNWTNLEYEIAKCVEGHINNIIFFQDTLPNCLPKYWKVLNGKVVEMGQVEKDRVDAIELYTQKKVQFKGKRYQLAVDFEYIVQYYTSLAIMMLGKSTVINDVIDGIAYMWFDGFEPGHQEIVNGDATLLEGLTDVESFNPDNVQ